MEEKKELFSLKVRAGKRTYFFDVKETIHGKKYVEITESKSIDKSGFERYNIIIFEEDLEKFKKALIEVIDFIKG
jgi:hypothetical protein